MVQEVSARGGYRRKGDLEQRSEPPQQLQLMSEKYIEKGQEQKLERSVTEALVCVFLLGWSFARKDS